MSSSFARLANVTASTKRRPFTAGVFGVYATNLASLKITPLAPVDTGRAAELQRLLKLDTALRLFECYAQYDPDVLDGDVLVIGTKEYQIRAALPWSFRDDVRVNIIVEELKK